MGPFLLSSCSDDDEDCPPDEPRPEGYVVYSAAQEAYTASLSELPPGRAFAQELLHSSPDSVSLRLVSINPSGSYCAVFTFFDESENSRNWSGDLHFYDRLNGDLIRSLNKQDFVGLLSFPNADAAMEVVGMDWENDSVIVAHIVPRADFLPIATANLSLRYRLSDHSSLDIQASSSTAPFAIALPQAPEKALFGSSLVQGRIEVEGEELLGIGTVDLFDITFVLGE